MVEQDADNQDKITLDDARKIQPDAAGRRDVPVEATPPNFGRIAAQTAKQVILQRLRDEERRMVFEEYHEREGELLHGVVQRIENRTVYIELGKAEGVMAPSDQVPTERYYPGQRLRVYLVEVHDTHKGPQIIVSRNHKMMLRRLFEQEVPEIFNGTVELKAIAREAGARSKVAVVGPPGGHRPRRVLRGHAGRPDPEHRERAGWREDRRGAVEPGRRRLRRQCPEPRSGSERGRSARTTRRQRSWCPSRQLSLAIGKEGQNARLAAKLTGLANRHKAAPATEQAAPAGRRVGQSRPCLARGGRELRQKHVPAARPALGAGKSGRSGRW